MESMTDLAAWLLAQIKEDEAAAQHARWAMQDQWFTTADDKVDEFVQHMSPARVLAECATKKAIVEWHRSAAQAMPDDPLAQEYGNRYCFTCSDDDMSYWNDREPPEWPCPTLRLLAQPYADRPGFDPAWKVEKMGERE